MDTARLDILESLYHEALRLAPEERGAFVALACGSDESLHEMLQAWLAHAHTAAAQPFAETAGINLAPLGIAAVKTHSLQSAVTTTKHGEAVRTDDAPARVTNEQTKRVAEDGTVAGMLDHYRMLALLGSGAMGKVYLAEDTQLGKRVALKILPGSFAQDVDRVARFQREARMLALAQHPNIAEVYLLRSESTPPYLVMEYVPGETLGQRLKRGPLPLHTAVPFLRQIAAALETAHARKVIHRDLKPDNIKLMPDGTLKLLDFGLAKQMRDELPTRDDAQPRAVEVFSTERHVIAGTVPYMSPEQTHGVTLDVRSDLWAFGCVAYEMLTGQRPFNGMTTHELFQAIRSQEPQWNLLPTDTPQSLRRLIELALRKDREERLSSATDAIKALAHTSKALSARARWRPWRKRALVAALALIGLSGAVYRQPVAAWLKAKLGFAATSQAAFKMPANKRLLIVPFKEAGKPSAFGEHLALALQENLRDVPGLQVMPYAEKLRLPSRASTTVESVRPLGVNLLLTGDIQTQGNQRVVRYWFDDLQGQRLMSAKAVTTTANLEQAQHDVAAAVSLSLQAQQPLSKNGTTFQNPAHESAYYAALETLQDDLAPDELRALVESLAKLQKDEPQVVPLLVTLADAQLRLAKDTNADEQFRQAQQYTEQALRLDENDLNARLARGRLRLLLGDAAAAQADLLQVLQKRPSDIEALRQLGESHAELAQWEQAEQAFKAMTTYWPGYWGGYNDLGAYYFDRGELPAALTNWQQVVALYPNGGIGYVNLGNVYLQMGKFNEAIASYEQARRQTFADQTAALEAFIGLSAAHYYAKSYVQAAEVGAEGLLAYPNNPTLYGNRGDALRYQTGQELAAIEAYTKAINWLERSPQPTDILATLAEFYAKRSLVSAKLAETKSVSAVASEQAAAKRYLQRALRGTGAASPEVQQRALLVYELLGDRSQALARLTEALKMGLDPALLAAEPDLDQLRLDARYELLIRQYQRPQR